MAWIKTNYTGVRYREHPTRKLRNGQPDKYFTIRYKLDGKLTEEPLGWASEDWTALDAYKARCKVLKGATVAEGPQSLADIRRHAREARAAETAAEADELLDSLTYRDFLINHYMPVSRKNKRSWRTDEWRINGLIAPPPDAKPDPAAPKIRPLGHIPLRAVTSDHVQAFLDDLIAAGRAPGTIKQYMGLIRRSFNVAAITQSDDKPLFSGQNPAQGVTIPAVFDERDRYLMADEAEDLIAAAAKRRCPDLHDAIVLSLNTGLRLGELRRLTWADVNFAAGIVTVREEAKRKPGGKVPLNDTALGVFKRRKEAVGKSAAFLVFPPVRGGELRENLSHDFRALADEVGLNADVPPDDNLRRVVFHTLRHTFASWLAIGGTDIYRIKTLMRHKTIQMTMRYAHLIPDATRDAVHNLRPPTGP